jgi:hypothetical protein
MKTENKKTLQISYEDFLAVLKRLDKYTFVLLKKFAQNMPTSFEMDSYISQHIFITMADKVQLSEMGELLWLSLQDYKIEADKIHDTLFEKEQIEYFKSKFSDVHSLASDINGIESQNGVYDNDDPMESFIKLGKTAQFTILNEGFLEIALKNYEQAKPLAKKIGREEEEERLKSWREHREKQDLLNKLKQEARELDKNKCVICNGGARNRFLHLGTELVIENFFQSCSKHEHPYRLNKSMMKFGRFENKD